MLFLLLFCHCRSPLRCFRRLHHHVPGAREEEPSQTSTIQVKESPSRKGFQWSACQQMKIRFLNNKDTSNHEWAFFYVFLLNLFPVFISRSSGGSGYAATTVLTKNARNATTKPTQSRDVGVVNNGKLVRHSPKIAKDSDGKNNQPTINAMQGNNVWRMNYPPHEVEGNSQHPHNHQVPPKHHQWQYQQHQLQNPNHQHQLEHQIAQQKHLMQQNKQQQIQFPYHSGNPSGPGDVLPSTLRLNSIHDVAGGIPPKNQGVSRRNHAEKQAPDLNGLIAGSGSQHDLRDSSEAVTDPREDDRLPNRTRLPTPTPQMISAEGLSEAECDREPGIHRSKKQRRRGINFSIAV